MNTFLFDLRIKIRNKHHTWCAPVAELVDAADSKSVAREGVLVRVRPGAPLS